MCVCVGGGGVIVGVCVCARARARTCVWWTDGQTDTIYVCVRVRAPVCVCVWKGGGGPPRVFYTVSPYFPSGIRETFPSEIQLLPVILASLAMADCLTSKAQIRTAEMGKVRLG